jgi:hypothetical protein
MRNVIITDPTHINYLKTGYIVVKRGACWLVNVDGLLLVMSVRDFDWI